MEIKLKNRIKSLLWRAAGMAVIAVGAYVLQVGDVFSLDARMLVNLAVMAIAGLIVGEVTKYFNS